MLRQLARVMSLGLISIACAGCCCVQGMPSGACGTGACSAGGCGSGMCGGGPLMSLASCRGACGEVYVDEWVSEPPVVDNCGANCGGCERCYQPVRNVLKMLWGRPYMSSCDSGLCAPSCGAGCDLGCDGGCGADSGYSDVDYGDSGYDTGSMGEVYQDHGPTSGQGQFSQGKSCNCGKSHAPPMQSNYMPAPHVPNHMIPNHGIPGGDMPNQGVPQIAPEVMPTPAPSLAPISSARRLNPALSRRR